VQDKTVKITVAQEAERKRLTLMDRRIVEKASKKDLDAWIKALRNPRKLMGTKAAQPTIYYNGWKRRECARLQVEISNTPARSARKPLVNRLAMLKTQKWSDLTAEERGAYCAKQERVRTQYLEDSKQCQLPRRAQTGSNLFAIERNKHYVGLITGGGRGGSGGSRGTGGGRGIDGNGDSGVDRDDESFSASSSSSSDVQKRIGLEWKSMNEQDKADWNLLARNDAVRCVLDLQSQAKLIDAVEEEIKGEIEVARQDRQRLRT